MTQTTYARVNKWIIKKKNQGVSRFNSFWRYSGKIFPMPLSWLLVATTFDIPWLIVALLHYCFCCLMAFCPVYILCVSVFYLFLLSLIKMQYDLTLT
jgi:hypothetical protein